MSRMHIPSPARGHRRARILEPARIESVDLGRFWAPALWLVAIGALVLAAAPASAEIFKCQGADGKTLYTTDDSQCPGVKAHEIKGQVQVSQSSRTRPTTARPRRTAPAAIDDQGQRATWQSKKQAVHVELQEKTLRLGYVESAVRACNRGAELWVEDKAGVRRNYKCELVDAEYEELTREVAELEHYIAEGLEEECRRAGCLPGWLR